MEKEIMTSIRSAQHPNDGQHIQQLLLDHRAPRGIQKNPRAPGPCLGNTTNMNELC